MDYDGVGRWGFTPKKYRDTIFLKQFFFNKKDQNVYEKRDAKEFCKAVSKLNLRQCCNASCKNLLSQVWLNCSNTSLVVCMWICKYHNSLLEERILC